MGYGIWVECDESSVVVPIRKEFVERVNGVRKG
jgi:hypothetical protein